MKGVTYWELIWLGMHDVTMILLTFSAIISISLGLYTEGFPTGCFDGGAIIVAILVCLNVSAVNDLQKDKQFRMLNAENNRSNITVIRDGHQSQILVDDLVVGDIVQISAGDTVPADGIYLSGNNVKMDESKLTGESDQVEKGAKNPFIVSSSECHEGTLTMVVVAVGPHSVFGRMRSMIESSGNEFTPLQVKLARLAKQLSGVGGFMAVITVLVIVGMHLYRYFSGQGTVDAEGNPYWARENWNAIIDAFIEGVAIMVLAIPEGLPLAVAIALAYSVKKMMKDNNLVRHLSACETMGSANTICSDKTGTLTQNQMTVVQGWVYNSESEDQSQLLNTLKSGDQAEYDAFIAKCKQVSEVPKMLLLENALLNNDAFLTKNVDGREVGVGSAVEVAMLKWARLLGVDYLQMRDKNPQLKEDDGKTAGIIKLFPFHSARKRSSCLLRLPNGKFRLYVKGAPEMVIRLCDAMATPDGNVKELSGTFEEDSEGNIAGSGSRKKIVQHCIYPMAKQALRVLAFAYRDFDTAEDWDKMVTYATEEQKGVGECPAVESGLTLVALLGFQDPVRPEVPQAVADCQKAGIFVRMVTGDNMETAKAIARQCNIYNSKGYVDGQGRKYPPGRAILGSQFREITGGLVLPPHFYHKCQCKDCSADPYFVPGFKTPDYPTHFGYPSIVGHCDERCKDWTAEAVAKRGEGKSACTKECKERGCMYQVANPNDARQLQQYYVVKNQGQFDQFVDTLQVMARSAPTDKHLLVTGLMERHQVVAVTGDGTNDGPALAKSNVGFAMGITGTSVAKDASDIVLMDDNFVSIVKAVMWGRNVYDSIRKFLQFQLTVNVGALLISFVSAVLLSESPLQPVQLLWVNLIMDTFAALALATELPTPKLLDRAPSNREESLVSPIMMRNILGHVLYQFTLLMFFVYKGHQFLNVPIGRGLGQNAEPTVHYTMVFNIFVMLQVFNEFNSRKINNEWNVFENVFTNPMFWLIVLGTIVVQLVIVEIGGEVMKTASLSWSHIAFSLLIGILTLIYQQLVRTVPGNWFVDLNSKKDGGADWLWAKLRPKTTEQALPSVTTQSYSAMKPEMKRIFTM